MTNTTAKQMLYETIRKIDGAYATSTIPTYRSNFESFIKHSVGVGRYAPPATDETFTFYIKHLTQSKYKSASISIAIASIATITN